MKCRFCEGSRSYPTGRIAMNRQQGANKMFALLDWATGRHGGVRLENSPNLARPGVERSDRIEFSETATRRRFPRGPFGWAAVQEGQPVRYGRSVRAFFIGVGAFSAPTACYSNACLCCPECTSRFSNSNFCRAATSFALYSSSQSAIIRCIDGDVRPQWTFGQRCFGGFRGEGTHELRRRFRHSHARAVPIGPA